MLRQSRQVDGGGRAPDFALPDTGGRIRTLAEFDAAPALLVAFLCHHCPFVIHVADAYAAFAHDYAGRGLQVVAISSNDIAAFPEDGPEHMGPFAAAHGFPFPYLYDGDQSVARADNAICTPDFFLYGPDRTLAYAGQFNSSRPKIDRPPLPGVALRTDLPVTGEDMRAAVDAVLAGRPVPEPQRPSAGCSIKWREGAGPSWA